MQEEMYSHLGRVKACGYFWNPALVFFLNKPLLMAMPLMAAFGRKAPFIPPLERNQIKLS